MVRYIAKATRYVAFGNESIPQSFATQNPAPLGKGAGRLVEGYKKSAGTNE